MSKKENAIEIIKSCHNYFYRIVPGVEKLAERLKDRPESCISDLMDVCEGIAWLCSAFLGTEDFHSVDVDIELVKRIQSNIGSGLENRDYFYISETLENEMLPMLIQWFEAVDRDFGSDDSVSGSSEEECSLC